MKGTRKAFYCPLNPGEEREEYGPSAAFTVGGALSARTFSLMQTLPVPPSPPKGNERKWEDLEERNGRNEEIDR